MHRALTCHDILVQLFESILAHRTGGRHQLAQIARCCKTLSEPALDVLWTELDDLIPLLRILPAFQLVKARGEYKIHGTINDDDWHRFNHFAHRVRKLRSISRHKGNINAIGPSVFRRLSQHFGRLPILPLLSTLITHPCDGISLLLSSPLSSLTLSEWCYGDRLALNAILDVLAGINETLEHLVIPGNSLHLTVSIVQFKGLRSLTIPNVDLHDIFSISTLPHLEKFDISLDPDLVLNAKHLAEPLFRSLSDFTVLGTVKQITQIFMYIRPGTLRSVALRVEDGSRPATLNHWKYCLRALVSQPLHSLRSIDIDFTLEDLEEDTQPWLTHAFESLFPLRQLQSIKLQCYRASITDETISKIASMWPDLTTLSLPIAHNPKATFRSLHLLATAYPHLIYLGLNIDTSGLRAIELPRQLTHGLQTWDAGNTRGSLLLLARYVHRLFPYLGRVETSIQNGECSLPELVSLCQGVEADAGSRPAKRSYSRITDSLVLAT